MFEKKLIQSTAAHSGHTRVFLESFILYVIYNEMEIMSACSRDIIRCKRVSCFVVAFSAGVFNVTSPSIEATVIFKIG